MGRYQWYHSRVWCYTMQSVAEMEDKPQVKQNAEDMKVKPNDNRSRKETLEGRAFHTL